MASTFAAIDLTARSPALAHTNSIGQLSSGDRERNAGMQVVAESATVATALGANVHRMPVSTSKSSPYPPIYAGAETIYQYVCAACYVEPKQRIQDPEKRKQWNEIETSFRARWASIPDDERKKQGIDGPLGWVQLYFESAKWRRMEGRCPQCISSLAIGYLMLLEDMRGEPKLREFHEQCLRVAAEANSLALEIAASGYQPGTPISEMPAEYAHLPELEEKHVNSLGILITEDGSRESILAARGAFTVMHWRRGIRFGLRKLLASRGTPDVYEPLALGAQAVWEVAVLLRQKANGILMTKVNFASVVSDYTKDPHNPPERLALVVTYQRAQEMVPPMGYGELAKVLIERDVVDGKWSTENVDDLKENIKRAVKKYRSLMPIPRFKPGAFEEGTTPP